MTLSFDIFGHTIWLLRLKVDQDQTVAPIKPFDQVVKKVSGFWVRRMMAA